MDDTQSVRRIDPDIEEVIKEAAECADKSAQHSALAKRARVSRKHEAMLIEVKAQIKVLNVALPLLRKALVQLPHTLFALVDQNAALNIYKLVWIGPLTSKTAPTAIIDTLLDFVDSRPAIWVDADLVEFKLKFSDEAFLVFDRLLT